MAGSGVADVRRGPDGARRSSRSAAMVTASAGHARLCDGEHEDTEELMQRVTAVQVDSGWWVLAAVHVQAELAEQ